MVEASPREVLLRHGRWVGATEFAKLVAEKRNVSERQAKTLISRAYTGGEIKKHVFPDRTVIYGLAEFGPPISETTHRGVGEPEVERVRKALEDLRREFRFFKEPTVREVALRAGLRPELAESVLCELAPETGWGEPPDNPQKEAEDAINLAGWICWKQKYEQNPQMQTLAGEEIRKASKGTLRRAQMLAGSFPDLVAKVSLTEIVWPEETKSKWTEIFNSQAPSPFWKTSKGFVSAKELLDTPAYKQLMRDF